MAFGQISVEYQGMTGKDYGCSMQWIRREAAKIKAISCCSVLENWVPSNSVYQARQSLYVPF